MAPSEFAPSAVFMVRSRLDKRAEVSRRPGSVGVRTQSPRRCTVHAASRNWSGATRCSIGSSGPHHRVEAQWRTAPSRR